jgi:hypothetical protein
MTYAFATVIGPRVFNVPASPPVAAHGLQVSQHVPLRRRVSVPA